MWIFLAQQEFYPHDLVDTSSEIVDKSKQHGEYLIVSVCVCVCEGGAHLQFISIVVCI